MEKDLRSFIKKIFDEYSEYDLYHYINGAFVDDTEIYIKSNKDNEVVNFICDRAYELDIDYYDNKNKYGYDKAYSILIDDINNLKKEAIKLLD